MSFTQPLPDSIALRSTPHDKRPTLNALTGLRFIAALFVFLYHFGAGLSERLGAPTFISNILRHGYMGVSLFFILSGFILTYNYIDTASKKGWLGGFFLARFARIYPVYALALLSALPLVWKTLRPSQAALVLTMLQAWTPPQSKSGHLWIMQAWTLSVELCFYILFPVLIKWIKKLTPTGLAILTLLCWFTIVYFGTPHISPGTRPSSPLLGAVPLPLIRLSEFVVGITLCRIFLTFPSRFKALTATWVTGGLILAVLIPMAATNDDRLSALAVVGVTLLIPSLALNGNVIAQSLSSRVMILLGGASYSLYLLQGPVREWLNHLGRPGLAQLLNPLLVVSLAIVVFLYWEQPMRKLVLSMAKASFGNRVLTGPTVAGAVNSGRL